MSEIISVQIATYVSPGLATSSTAQSEFSFTEQRGPPTAQLQSMEFLLLSSEFSSPLVAPASKKEESM